MKQPYHCLVLLSGGQDSVTCLGLALAKYEKVSAISFDYGQRHKVELETAQALCAFNTVPWKLVELPFVRGLVASALLNPGADVAVPHAHKPGLPASFVPNRNALLLTIAHAHAQEIGASVVMAGMCQTDYSGYPDCREQFVRSLQHALNEGYETSIAFYTPLMHKTKAETFALASELGWLDVVVHKSHTCYLGVDHQPDTYHPWGYGCGTCPACQLRAKGWQEFTQMGGKAT